MVFTGQAVNQATRRIKGTAGVAQVGADAESVLKRFRRTEAYALAHGCLLRFFGYVVRPVRTAVEQPVFRRRVCQRCPRQQHMAVVTRC